MISISRAMSATGSFFGMKKKTKTRKSLAIDIPVPVQARIDLQVSPPSTPPMLSASSSASSASFESLPEPTPYAAAMVSPVLPAKKVIVAEKPKRLSQEYFFPDQKHFECVVPAVTSAKSVYLKDHPVVEGQYAEYDRLYNADSVQTVDGRFMVRLL